jgi:A/G-specific adenine glycosylase
VLAIGEVPSVARPSSRFTDDMLGWFAVAREQRDSLPWRQRRDPWEVLVSEVMLAQTQASRVAAPYLRFIDQFPDAAACARANEGEVLRAWSGLGYNRRALNLHKSARRIMEHHGGAVPAELASLLELPGVGPYTARAVAAFAFELPVGVVDTNVGRVLARAVAGSRLARLEAQALADDLVVPDRAREWNLALMDFGNLICTARNPRCADCPLGTNGGCAWRRAGVEEDPAAGSAAVSRRQPPFRGSDREIRGRLVRTACLGPIGAHEVVGVAGVPDAPGRAMRIAEELVTEGLLAQESDGSFVLP